MRESPELDARDREALLEDLLDRADQYTDDWDPRSPDNGTALLRIFSHLAHDVTSRLNDVPEKHRIAFLDALDFDRRPPQAARLPLRFEVSSDIERNVAIPGGTRAVARPADGSEQLFEVPQDEGFEATAATLTDVIAVDPDDDAIVDHGPDLLADEPVTLFTGTNCQQHALYLGGEDLLNVAEGSPVTVRIDANVHPDTFRDGVVWEYYAERDGEAGWYSLRGHEAAPAEEADGLEALQRRLQSRSRDGSDAGDEVFEETFQLPNPPETTTVGGIEGRWLRCRIVDAHEEHFATRIRSATIGLGRDGEDGLEPDGLLANDVPLSTESDVRPFGRVPQPPATLYVASQEAFTKPGATVDVVFDPPSDDEAAASDSADDGEESDGRGAPGLLSGPPEISWEYWNGGGWARLTILEDGTDTLQEPGSVRFEVPEDLEETAVSGHEGAWIRARLVSGSYGHPSFEVTDEGRRGDVLDEPDPPVFGDVTVDYDGGRRTFEDVLTDNNAAVERHDPTVPNTLQPFRSLEEDEQTVYLGFDDTLRDGPLTVFVPVEDATYPRTFDPGARWEYCEDPRTAEWTKLDVRDRTGGLTERGVVKLTFPEQTSATDRFDRRRHWVRVRFTQDEFVVDRARDDARDQPVGERGGVRSRGRTETPEPSGTGAGGDAVTTADGAGSGFRTESASRSPADSDSLTTGVTLSPPVLEGIYPNTQWARNTRTVEDEILGSSDGSHEQSFELAQSPAIDVSVWVDELEALSTSERRELAAERPDAVESVVDDGGQQTAFWVRWQQVPDFLDAGREDRVYVIDRTDGTVRFGDGEAGAIPPNGQDNVRATYTTGGGSDGNVDAGTITDLKSSISLVESVSNPRPADGGADVESMAALVERSTGRIRHRDRAVCASDLEQVARGEFRELSKVKCEPEMAPDGTQTPGWVSLLVVPQARREKPVPSMELKQRVRATVADRAPASLVERDQTRIVVRGPRYAEVGVDVRLEASDVKSVSLLKATVERRLDEYLHPLTGRNDSGWPFGEAPSVTELVELLDDVDAVTSVLELSATVDTRDGTVSLARQEGEVSLSQDALVCSGVHRITVTMGGVR